MDVINTILTRFYPGDSLRISGRHGVDRNKHRLVVKKQVIKLSNMCATTLINETIFAATAS